MTHLRSELPGQDTLLACWGAIARLSPDARVLRATDSVAAVFPNWAPLNNAILLERGDGTSEEAAAARVAVLFAAAAVDAWALWRPSRATDLDAPDDGPGLFGFARDTTTLVMTAALPAGLRTAPDVVPVSLAATAELGEEPVPVGGLGEPDGIPGLSAWALVEDGVAVAGAWSYLHEHDCGVFGVETVPQRRRRGLGRALVEHVLADAARRGARTASLQSTRMGQPLYASLGFAPVGRYEERVPR